MKQAAGGRAHGAAGAADVVDAGVPPRRILVCHPELLLGQAVAAALGEMGLGAEPVVVTSAERLMAQAGAGFDLAIVSDQLGDELGELLEALAYRDSNLPVLVLSRHNDFAAAAQALEWGAVGSVSSASPIGVLAGAVVSACEGHTVYLDGAQEEVHGALAARRAARGVADALHRSLTARERTLVEALASGRTAVEIARELHLSPHTIRAAIRVVGEKLGAKGQLRIAAASRDLLHAVSLPSQRFVQRQEPKRHDPRAG